MSSQYGREGGRGGGTTAQSPPEGFSKLVQSLVAGEIWCRFSGRRRARARAGAAPARGAGRADRSGGAMVEDYVDHGHHALRRGRGRTSQSAVRAQGSQLTAPEARRRRRRRRRPGRVRSMRASRGPPRGGGRRSPARRPPRSPGEARPRRGWCTTAKAHIGAVIQGAHWSHSCAAGGAGALRGPGVRLVRGGGRGVSD